MTDFALLVLRLTVGTLMAGHGSQKLFGWFGGPGLKGTHGFMEMLGMRPGKIWGTMAALGEFSGGVLTFLGFLNPLGPLNIAASMWVATRRAHWNKPIWNTGGGAELPVTNMSVALAIGLAGPGRYSLDRLIGFRMPRALVATAWIGVAAAVGAAVRRPELVEKVIPDTLKSALGPDLEMENRPRAEAEQTAEV